MANTTQTNKLEPVPSAVPPLTWKEEGKTLNNQLNHTWMQWFINARTKINLLNPTLAALSTSLLVSPAGTYGDATHSVTMVVNQYGQVTGVTSVLISGGGGVSASKALIQISLGW